MSHLSNLHFSFWHWALLACAVVVACVFEFINGFHDTANAVATVIYTRSLKPWTAVIWSGLCNFAGVFLGGTAVAMGVVKLLPPQIMMGQDVSASIAVIFALLLAAIFWNFGTWFLGLPASSSHTLIGAIIGIGMASAYAAGHSVSEGINWTKAHEIGLALLISPLVGFGLSAGLLKLAKVLLRDPIYHEAPKADSTPPWRVRGALIATCTGVSIAHGSNDGQKGVGLVMLVLITLVPAQFAMRDVHSKAVQATLVETADRLDGLLAASAAAPSSAVLKTTNHTPDLLIPEAEAAETVDPVQKRVDQVRANLGHIGQVLRGANDPSGALTAAQTLELRGAIYQAERGLTELEKNPQAAARFAAALARIKQERRALVGFIEYAPIWVIMLIAFCLGIGTTVGWKRIVVTLGERIGKTHLTFAQGASAELVAMTTIGLSAFAGVPVSTTHVLSSGIAGTMVAGKGGVQGRTIRNILLAWVLTLPAATALSFSLFLALRALEHALGI